MDNGGSAGAAGGLAILFLIALALAAYFLPTIIAMSRSHHQVGPVLAINLFLGWTFIGWIVALVIAVSAKRQPVTHAHYYPGGPYPPPGYPPPGYPPPGYPPQGQRPQPPPPSQAGR